MKTHTAILSALLLVGAGCASTRVASQWTDQNLTEAAPRKILVVARVPTQSVRHIVESELAGALQKQGIKAVPLTGVNGSQGTSPSNEEIAKAMEAGDFDGLLVSRYIQTVNSYPYGDGWYGYGYPFGYPYPYAYGGYYGYMQQSAVVETSLFDQAAPGQNRLLWSATSSTPESGAGGTAVSNRDVAHYAKVIAQRLSKDIAG